MQKRKGFIWILSMDTWNIYSESAVNRVRDYIKNQEEHHKMSLFQEEYDKLMFKYGFDKFISG